MGVILPDHSMARSAVVHLANNQSGAQIGTQELDIMGRKNIAKQPDNLWSHNDT
jgi:hypothetical protein